MRYRCFETAFFLHALIGFAALAQANPDREATTQTALPGEQEPSTAAPDPCSESPWYCGVSRDQQQRALALYQEGNDLFDDSLFVGAVAKYQTALEHWEHPGIHYNLMLALVALDRPLEAYESNIAALRHGPKSLQPDEYLRALDYQKLLRGRIAVLEVSCDEPGAVVALDGKPLFLAPGTVHRFVLPGQHELVAKKPNHVTAHQTLMLMPNEPQRVQVALLPAEQAMITTRRWDGWRPWAVVGSGVGLGLLGTMFEWRAEARNEGFKEHFSSDCPPPGGCFESTYTSEIEQNKQRRTWYRHLGHGASVAGAATALTGLVLVYLNRPQQMENPARRHLIRISAAPSVSPESAVLTMQVDF